MRLVVDVAAWDDLNHIGAWIAKDNPSAARAVLEKILQTIEHLHAFPRLSRPGRARGTYERVVAGTPYIVVFELQRHPTALVIVAVAHGARNR
jgi:plasmid stabilization system protein ParE